MSDIGAMNYPLIMNETRKLVSDLKLQYYADQSRLDFLEALYILRTKVELSNESFFDEIERPWKIEGHAQDKIINTLLLRSLQVQMGRIRSTELDEFILSNDCLTVCGLLHIYLRNLGIPSDLKCGVFAFSASANSDGTPHVWLNIDEKLVENTFLCIPNSKATQDLVFKTKSEEYYFEEDLALTQRKLFWVQNDNYKSRPTGPHTPLLYKFYTTPTEIEKVLVASFKMASVNPRPKMYDIAMKDIIKTEFNTIISEDLETKWSNTCWSCMRISELKGEDLKTCSGCKLAKYCDQKCQKLDWKCHKILHKEIDLIASTNSIVL